MKIGFDFDKVFIDYPPFFPPSLINRIYKKQGGKAFQYRIQKKPEQLIRITTHFSLFRPVIKKNLLVLSQTKYSKNHSFYLISSRFGFLQKRTDVLIRKYNLDQIFSGMHFNYQNKQPHLFKEAVIKKIGIQRYVDDDLELLEYLTGKNPTINFFWLNPSKKGKIKNRLSAIKDIKDVFL